MSGLTVGDIGKGSVLIGKDHLVFFMGDAKGFTVIPYRSFIEETTWFYSTTLGSTTKITTCPAEFALRCD